ncbi:hypothetical protein HMPREF3156_01466 [Neisseria sp. HMSC06F02]|nr:hypothetical protein HMPREF3156_01466 [Neisseria sp. HMSC06F02]
MRTGSAVGNIEKIAFTAVLQGRAHVQEVQPAVCMKLRGMGDGRMAVEIIGCGANAVRPGNEMTRDQIGIVQGAVAAAYGDVGLIVLQVVQSIAEIEDGTDFGKLGLQSCKRRLKSAGTDDAGSQGDTQFADGFGFEIVDNGTRIGKGGGEAAAVFAQGTAGIGRRKAARAAV